MLQCAEQTAVIATCTHQQLCIQKWLATALLLVRHLRASSNDQVVIACLKGQPIRVLAGNLAILCVHSCALCPAPSHAGSWALLPCRPGGRGGNDVLTVQQITTGLA